MEDFEYRDDGLMHQNEGGYRFVQTDLGPVVDINKKTGMHELNKDVVASLRKDYRFNLSKMKKHIHIQTNKDPCMMPNKQLGIEYFDIMTGKLGVEN